MESKRSTVLLSLAALAGAWSFAALLTGGVKLQIAGVSLSSRNPVRSATIAILLAAAAWRLHPQRLDRLGSSLLRRLAKLNMTVVPVAALFLFGVGVVFGGRSAIAADSFGYISQSMLWRRGNLTIEQPFVANMPWPDADWTFSPLGYRPGPDHTLVPTYPPGFPLLMTGARFISSCGPYYVVPVAAALLVVFTAILGRRVFDPTVATVGAVLVAVSPVVLLWTMSSPMTDVPVSMLWLAALTLADSSGLKKCFAAGMLAGVAISIRPNLAPLAIFPLLLSIARGGRTREVILRTVMVGLPVMLFAFFVAAVHNTLYGSPFISGYGDLSLLYSWGNLPSNLQRYPSWWWHAHGLVGCLFIIGILRRRERQAQRRVTILSLFALTVALEYVFYLPFDDWTFLRFLLPALPVVMLLSADSLVWMCRRLGPSGAACAVLAATVIAVMSGIHRARWDGFFEYASDNQRYVDAALYIDAIAPQAAVVFAMQHSGSVRFYSGRQTLRYDLLDAEWLDRSLDTLERLGFSTYALLEDWEEQSFRNRFRGQTATTLLDAGPLAIRRTGRNELRLFALRSATPRPVHGPLEIPRTSRFNCLDPASRFY